MRHALKTQGGGSHEVTHSKKSKLVFIASVALVGSAALCLLTGCFSAHKRTESLIVNDTFDPCTGKRIGHQVWRDRSRGGGTALLSDPRASQIDSAFTNQTALGGGSTMSVGQISSKVSTNGIKSVGGAGGELINTALTGGKDKE